MAKQIYIPVAQHLGKQVVITLKRSIICTVPKQRAYCQTLKLKKVGDTRECEYTPQIHGMVKLMPHLVDVKVKG
ncbi:MAG: 50S ribosomal protein L30 [Holophagaceae bacterium]|nr:50S ribosomal protein L30 [Holophagaceae bacterium]